MSCTKCTTPTAEGIALCIDCVLKLEAILDNAPDLLADAETTTARMDRIGRSEAGGGGSREGINIECMDRARELHELLVSWARLTLEECGERGVEVGHGLSPAELMRDHTGVIRLCDWAGDCLDELGRASRRLVQAVDVPPDKLDLGACGVEGCFGRIAAHLAPNPKWEPGGRAPKQIPGERAWCGTCHARYSGKEVYAFQVARTHGELRTVRETARLIEGIPGAPSRSTLQRWIKRGWVQVHEGDLIEPAQVVTLIQREAA